MEKTTIKLLVFIVLLVHGIGHFQGVITGFGVKFKQNNSYKSWALKSFGDTINKAICIIVYAMPGLFAILAALSFYNIIEIVEWTFAAQISAMVSTIALILFPKAFAMFFNTVGAWAVNIIIIYSILLDGKWPAEIFSDFD